jgi:hypothetical protein
VVLALGILEKKRAAMKKTPVKTAA